MGEIFANHLSGKRPIPKERKLSKLNGKKANNIVRKWTKNMNSYFTQENTQIISRYMKIHSTQLAVRKITNTK